MPDSAPDNVLKELLKNGINYRCELVSDKTWHVARHLNAMKIDGLYEPANLIDYVKRHNADMKMLLEENDETSRKRAALGISPSRIRSGIFPRPQKIIQHVQDGEIWISQRDFGRMLAMLMSHETARRIALSLWAAGLIKRQGSEYDPSTLLGLNNGLEDEVDTYFSEANSELAALGLIQKHP